jgi:lipoprotein-releasing system permease protein
MPWFIQLALRQIFPSGRRRPSSFFIVSTLGVTLGVMILVIVQSIMGGFDHQHRAMMILTSGHMDVRRSGGIIYDDGSMLATIKAHREVAAAVPYAQGVVMLTHNDHPAFPFIMGLDFSQDEQVIPFRDLLVAGSVDDMDDDSILLSFRLASAIGAWEGSEVDVYTPLMVEKLKSDEVLLPRRLRVCGIYETGWTPFDSNTLVCTLPLMQDLYGMGGGIHGIGIRLFRDDDNLVVKLAGELGAELEGQAEVMTWMDTNRDFLWVLAMEKNLMLFLLLFIILVASFAIAVAQLLTVLRKTREIGLLGAMGARPFQMGVQYCFQGFVIGLCGVTLGSFGAVASLHYRDAIVNALASITGSGQVLVQFYQFSRLPVHYDTRDFVVIGLATLFISTAAGLLPALRAAYMNPAEALRSE